MGRAGGTMTPVPGRDELVPLADRLAVLQTVRLLVATAVLGVSAVMGNVQHRLVPLATTYIAITGIVEFVRRRARRRGLATVSATLLLDGVFLAFAVALTGGYGSPLLFLVFLEVMAVTLLVSYRTGLKIAVWYVILLFAGHAAAAARIGGIESPGSDRDAALSAIAFLLFAVGAAAFSSVNERALRRSRADLRGLVELGAELERARDPEDVVLLIAAHARERLGFERVAILTPQDDGWWGAVDDGGPPVFFEGGHAAGPLVNRMWAGDEPVLIRTTEQAPVVEYALPNAINFVVVPLLAEGESLGVVVAEWGHRRPDRIPALTVDTLAQSAAHAAMSLRNTWLLAEVERLATRDGLTGLSNRRLFEESLEREVARADRRGSPLALVVLDVDHFKDVNDTLGHQAGDAVLREVGRALSEKTKASDLPARYGGDEFVVLLPDCSGADCITVAERLRSAVAARMTTVKVTVSAGCAALPDNAHDGERLVAAADAALYEAKREGRNRTMRSTRRPFEVTDNHQPEHNHHADNNHQANNDHGNSPAGVQ
ncbi:MAG TPA: sensor domain-containing diguanylate cyclase [Acidimicrobiia bacterium]|nr:sensor domain-containing diguanylate cyclase [Acidimicrobiia bacterium]